MDHHGCLGNGPPLHRLVYKYFYEVHGVYYTETFAPVARMDSIRIVLAIVASKHWEVHHMNVKNYFSRGEIQEGMYMKKHEGLI